MSQPNVSKPCVHSLNTKKCASNVSDKYPWRDQYAKKSKGSVANIRGNVGGSEACSARAEYDFSGLTLFVSAIHA